MTYLRTWKKGKRLYFALVRTRRIKRGAKKGKVVQEVVRYIGTAKELYKFLEDAESKTRLEDVGVTKVLEYGPVLLFHKIAAMIGLREAIDERCKKNEAIPKIIEVISAYKAFKPLSKRKMAEDYPYTAFPMLLDLPQDRFYPQAMCRAMDAIKSSEMNGILSDLRKSLSLKHPVNVDRMLLDGTVITSEGTKCELLTFGYNPTGARKRQITIFLAVTEGENIPIHLRIAKGNVRAYRIFREILADLKSVKRTFTTIVDNGFITAESLSDLKKLELHIVTRLRHDSRVSKAVIRLVNGNFEEELYEYVVLATNVPKHSNVDTMDSYTKHYDIESVYRTLKSDIEVEPIRHWKKHRVESEVFLCVLALMLRSTLAILLREKAIPLSVNELLKKLEPVKLVELNGKVMKESMGEESELLSRIV